MKRTFFMLVWLLGLSLAEAQPGFTDVSQKAGFLPLPGAEGIAVGDFNNDGYEDVYVSNTQSTNLLYQNQGDGTFVEVAGLLGLALEPDTDSRTALWGDINNDGWLDLYVGNKAAPDRLFLNLRGEAFEDISSQAGIFQDGHPKSVNMADVNADGFLDIYVSNFASENALLLNQGDTSFVNAIYWSGALDKGLAMGTVIFDYDKDGDPDLYLVHDGREPNLLYENDGTGRFMEVAARAGVNTQSFGMGVDIGDINNDGWMDIYIANLGPNILLLNNGDGTFANISQLAGVEDAGMGWGTNLLDYDNDGLLDMYVANDFDFSPHPYYNVLYRNAGNLTFYRAEQSGPVSNQHRSYGTACIDYKLDGNLDLLVANKGVGEGVQLLRNASRPDHWVGLKLIGSSSNRQAIGAKVMVVDENGNPHYREVVAGQSWASQSTSLLHIGLGQASAIQEVQISWPSGLKQLVPLHAPDRYYSITEGGAFVEGIALDALTASASMQAAAPPTFGIFPNPTSGTCFLEFTTTQPIPLHIRFFDVLGRLLSAQSLGAGHAGKHRIPLNLPPQEGAWGARLFWVQLSGPGFQQTKRLILLP